MLSVHSLCVHGTKRQTYPTSSNSLVRLSNGTRKTTYQTSQTTTVRQVGMAWMCLPTIHRIRYVPFHRSLNLHVLYTDRFRTSTQNGTACAIVDRRSPRKMLTRLNQHTMADQSHRLLHIHWVSFRVCVYVDGVAATATNQKCYYVLTLLTV